MALLTVMVSLASLWGWCLFLQRRTGLSASLAPLAALSVLELAMLCAGMAGVLRFAVWLLLAAGWVFAAAFIGCAALKRKAAVGVSAAGAAPAAGPGRMTVLARRAHASARSARQAPGALVFWCGAVFLALRLCALDAQFTSFDEYSFWGTAIKQTVLNGKLYTECATGVPWQSTQYAALPLAGYWFAPFGRFTAWAGIFAADVLLLAGLAAVTAAAEKAGRRIWAALALAALAAPTLFTLSSHTANLSTAWLEVLGDVPAGVLFGAAAAYWLAVRGQSRAARWLTLPVLCLAANVKQNTFVLALAAAGLAALDVLLFAPDAAPETAGPRGAAGGKLRAGAARTGFAAALIAAPCLLYMSWSAYTTALVRQNAAAGGMGDTSEPLSAVVLNGTRMLLGGTGTAYYEARRAGLSAYMATMREWFFHRSVSLLGSGAAVCAVVAALFVLAVLLAHGVREKLRFSAWALGSAACFGGYWLMLLFSYAFVLKDSTPENPTSYARYFMPFYLGWFLLAAACFGQSAVQALRGAAAKQPGKTAGQGRALAARAAALALGLCFALRFAAGTEPQFTVLGVPRAAYDGVRARQALAQQAAQAAHGEKVFLVYQGDEGFQWFFYSEAMLPSILTYGAGGGTYGTPERENGDAYYQAYTPAEFAALVKESGARHLLVVQSDDVFTASYAALFTDELALAQNGPALYAVTASGFVPEAALAAGEGASV